MQEACLRAPPPAGVSVPAAFLGAGNPLRPDLSHHKAACTLQSRHTRPSLAPWAVGLEPLSGAHCLVGGC